MSSIKDRMLRFPAFIVSGIIYYLFLTPVAFIARQLGKEYLETKLDKSSKSYWHFRKKDLKGA